MKKRIAISNLAFCFIIVLFCISCEGSVYSVRSSGRTELYSVANVSVPFVSGDLDWDQVEEIEKDSYGRIMFKYRSAHRMEPCMLYDYSGKYVYAIIICQMYDNDYAYYYDNDNFIYLPDNEDLQSDRVEQFKKLNDWNKALDQSKMTRVSNSFFPYGEYGAYDEEKVTANISRYLTDEAAHDSNVKHCIDLVALDNSQRGLFAIREYSAHDDHILYNCYFAVCDEAYNVLTVNGEPCIIEIPDIIHCQDDMKKIKEMSGWNMPR